MGGGNSDWFTNVSDGSIFWSSQTGASVSIDIYCDGC